MKTKKENQNDIKENSKDEEISVQQEKQSDDISSGAEELSAEQPDDETETLKKELEDCRDRLLRTAAEYDNFRKRTEREKAQIYSDATCMSVLAILPAVDSLELAVKSSEGSSEGYKKGLTMVSGQIMEALKKLGVESFGKSGDAFDPGLHNAVSHIDDESGEENVISEVFQTGYKKGDRIIRHAMVQVKN